MRQLKKVIEALGTLRREPGKAIGEAWATVRAAVHVTPSKEAEMNNINAAVDLIDSIIRAVVGDLSAKTEEGKPASPQAEQPKTEGQGS